jgi:2-(1,2-epoxy-1,2-dihydrophenyl)acetyl-CoA isomerase
MDQFGEPVVVHKSGEDLCRLERRDGYAIVTLNRPSRLNAFNEAMHTQLLRALCDAEDDPDCRALLLTGEGRAFCAGQDLSVSTEETTDLSEMLKNRYNPLVNKLTRLPLPVVCAVNGIAAGAGANIAFSCDIVLAARSATFIQSFASIGLVPDSGGSWILPRLIGLARARGLSMLAQSLSAEQAADWGLIWSCVDDNELMRRAVELTAYLATQPTIGLALTKNAINAGLNQTLDKQLKLEAEFQGIAGYTPDYLEGVRAFLEKRKPRFSGKL